MTRFVSNSLLGVSALVAALYLWSRREGAFPDELPMPAGVSSAKLERFVGYRRGPWWASPKELPRVRLSARHILITHAQARDPFVLLGAVIHHSPRSRDDALRLVVAIAQKLEQKPELFEQLAARWSDDRVTGQKGGDLSVFAPLAVPGSLVDAIGALKPGQISRPVESEAGFHIVQRLAVPPPDHFCCERIAVGHRGSLVAVAPSARSRTAAEAHEIAGRLDAELARDPARFEQVARTQSDTEDGVRGGDIGCWSTYEDGAPSVFLGACGSLAVGATSRVIETEAGFEVMRRVADRPRAGYAFTELFVPYVGAPMQVVGVTLSKTEAQTFAERILGTIRDRGFDAARAELCQSGPCSTNRRAEVEGRGIPAIEQAVLEVERGGVAPRVLETVLGFHLVRREADPGPLAPTRAPSMELPSPPTVEQIIMSTPAQELARAFRQMGKDVVTKVKVPRPDAVVALFDDLAGRLERCEDNERVRYFAEARLQLRSLVGDGLAMQISEQLRADLFGSVGPRDPTAHGQAQP